MGHERLAAAEPSQPALREQPGVPTLSRSRYDEWLESHCDAPLRLVVAPAGSGKTTATRAWMEQQPGGVGWIDVAPGSGAQALSDGIAAALALAEASWPQDAPPHRVDRRHRRDRECRRQRAHLLGRLVHLRARRGDLRLPDALAQRDRRAPAGVARPGRVGAAGAAAVRRRRDRPVRRVARRALDAARLRAATARHRRLGPGGDRRRPRRPSAASR